MPEKEKPIYGEGQAPPWVKEMSLPGWLFGKWGGFSIPTPWSGKVLVGTSADLSKEDKKILREHEFVHAGQQRNGTNLPTSQATMDLLFGKGKDANTKKQIAKKQLKLLGYSPSENLLRDEAPAYAMQSGPAFEIPGADSLEEFYSVFAQTKEKDLFNYLNEIRRLNPENYASIETTIPDWLHREYIKSSPMPMMPVVHPKGIDYGKATSEAVRSSLLDALRGKPALYQALQALGRR